MYDGILARLSCKFLFSVLAMENSPLQSHADFIVHSCIRSATERGTPVCDGLYDHLYPKGYLSQRFQDVWNTDPINQENIVSLVSSHISGSKYLQQIISQKVFRYLEDAQKESQVVLMPTFGDATAQNFF